MGVAASQAPPPALGGGNMGGNSVAVLDVEGAVKAFVVVAVVLLGACDSGGGTSVVTKDDRPRDPATRYEAQGTVLESPEHGPQLCFGVALSLPPQCGGPDVIGWDWSKVDGEESVRGTTWGSYRVVGTWDGERLTLTEAPTTPKPAGAADGGADRLRSRCPEPDGGWKVVDRAKATYAAQEQVMARAAREPDFGGGWFDQSINPASRSDDEAAAEQMNDPTKLVVNLRFTGDLERHEREAREVWGGALCVSKAGQPLSKLDEIQAELGDEAEEIRMLSSSVDVTRGVVELQVLVADDALRDRLDKRYGKGVVELRGALRPVD